MTRDEFATAMNEGRRVRLLDRSRTFYVDEWYDPAAGDDGTFAIDTHTGERITVTDDLLAQLTTEPAVMTVGEPRRLLERYADDPRWCSGAAPAPAAVSRRRASTKCCCGPHAAKRPREARYAEAGFGDRNAPDAFDAVRIGHAVR